MADFEVVLTASAYEDLDKIIDHLMGISPSLSLKAYEQILASYRRLREFPLSGTAVNNSSLRLEGYRKLITDDYVTIYRFIGSVCVLDHIFSGKADYMKRLQDWI